MKIAAQVLDEIHEVALVLGHGVLRIASVVPPVPPDQARQLVSAAIVAGKLLPKCLFGVRIVAKQDSSGRPLSRKPTQRRVMSLRKRLCRIVGVVIVLAAKICADTLGGEPPTATIRVNLKEAKAPVSTSLYGIFLEEISHGLGDPLGLVIGSRFNLDACKLHDLALELHFVGVSPLPPPRMRRHCVTSDLR
jgi:hypothetical protein